MSHNIILYSGKDCCLCEQAEQLLIEVVDVNEVTINKINVQTSHDLHHLYGARIPVLVREDTQAELAWPFQSSDIIEFLA